MLGAQDRAGLEPRWPTEGDEVARAQRHAEDEGPRAALGTPCAEGAWGPNLSSSPGSSTHLPGRRGRVNSRSLRFLSRKPELVTRCPWDSAPSQGTALSSHSSCPANVSKTPDVRRLVQVVAGEQLGENVSVFENVF